MSKEKQYINIIRTNQNIKVDYQVLESNSITQTSQSVFLLQDNIFSSDTLFKLHSLEQNISQTYISALCESKEQNIVSNKEVKSKNCSYIPFDATRNIELNNTIVDAATLFNNNGNIDYLYSPFTILYTHLQENLEENSLNLFIHNDNIYALILNEEKRSVDSAIKSITPFSEIKNSEFYNDEVVEQKLYEEVYQLELTDIISSLTKSYYEKFNNSNFIEKVNIFYSMKQLSDEQLNNLSDEIMMDITYNSIHLDNMLYSIVQKNNAAKYSFINPRNKKTSFSIFTWFLIAVLTTGIVALFIILLDNDKEDIKEEVTQEIHEEPTQETKIQKIIQDIKIPDHRYINEARIAMIQNLFDTIDDQSVLKEIQIQEKESTMICDFFTLEAQKQFFETNIVKLYKKSEIVLMSESKDALTTIVTNNELLEPMKIEYKNYILANNVYMDSVASEVYLQKLLGDDVKIIFENETTQKYNIQNFTLTIHVKEPVHFYKMIESISKQSYSILLSYPIEFIKTTDSLEVTFSLFLNQNKKESDK